MSKRETIDYKIDEMQNRFPYQFQDHFHYQFPNGWINLFGIACCLLDELLESHGLNTKPQKAEFFKGWAQVKSKFAGARMYTHSVSSNTYPVTARAFRELIEQAESLSYEICERCGARGQSRSIDGWHLTACQKHFEERKQTRDMFKHHVRQSKERQRKNKKQR